MDEAGNPEKIRNKEEKDKTQTNSDNSPAMEISLPGFNRFRHSEYGKKKKIIWALSVAICVGCCIFQIADRISHFLSSPVTIDVIVTRILTVSFPSLSVCNGTLNKVLSEPWKLSSSERETIENMAADELWNYYKMDPEDINITVPCWTSVSAECEDLGEDVGNVKFNVSWEISNTVWGRCLASTPNEKVEYRGPFTVLHLEFKHKPVSEKAIADYPLVLHNQAKEMRHDSFYFAEFITLAHHYTIRISAKEFIFKNTRTNPCIAAKEALECRNACIEDKLDADLNCSLPFMNTSVLPICSNFNDSTRAYRKAIQIFGDLQIGDCECTRICEDVIYQSILDDKGPIRDSNQKTTMDIYYADNLHEKVVETFSYSFTALISDIGGSLGFFLGACMLTILEIGEAIITASLPYLKRERTPAK